MFKKALISKIFIFARRFIKRAKKKIRISKNELRNKI